MNQASSLDTYAASVENLRRNPTEQHDIEACRRHGAAISHMLRAPWWAKWWRSRRLHRLQRLHVVLAQEIPRFPGP